MKTNLKGQSAAARSKINSLRTHFGVLFFIFFLWSSVGWGQVTVTASAGTSSGSFTTLKGAFDAINAGTHQGVISISITANTTETASAVLNASGSGSASYSSISIQPSGGTAITISGAIPAGSPLIDLNGADNVTIDGLNTGGNSLTISNTTVSATSGTSTIRFVGGATLNTITNCFILGSSTMAVSTNGGNIFFSTDANTTNGNDNNTISNCNISAAGSSLPTKGIYMNGSTTTTTINNSGNSFTNNNIYDYFGAAVSSAGIYISSGNTNNNITNNKFYQTATRTFTTGATHSAVYIVNTTSADGYTITGNTIGYANSSGTGTYTIAGALSNFFNGIYFSGISTSSTNVINSNVISDISFTTTNTGTTAGSYPFVGINLATSAGTVSIQNNIIRNINLPGTGTCTIAGIDLNSSGTGNHTVNGNTIDNITRTSAGTIYGIKLSSPTNSTFNNNTISNLAINNTTSTNSIYGIFGSSSSVNVTCSTNTIFNLTSTSTAGITIGGIREWGGAGNKVATGNNIYNLSSSGNIGTIYGIYLSASSTPNPMVISTNTIYNLSEGSTIYPIYNSSSSSVCNINNNNIYSISSAVPSAVISGIYNTSGITINIFQNIINGLSGSGTSTPIISAINNTSGTTVNIYRNKIYNLSQSGTISTNNGAVNGILLSGGTTVNAYNNLIGGLTSPNANLADAIRGISITSSTASTSYNIYNNTVYLTGSSVGTNFGSSGIYHAASSTSTTAALDLQNNMIFNTCTPSGTGIVTAFRRSAAATLGNYASSSNKNLFYAGTPSATNTIMSDGTNNYQTISTYQTAVSTRDANSFTETSFNPATYFVSTTGSDATYLQPASGLTTIAEGGGNTIAMCSPDYNGVTRPGFSGAAFDVGAWEFAGVSPAPVLTNMVPSPALTSQCTKAARTISIDITTSAGSVTGATLNYSHNGTAQPAITMTNSSGNTWSGTMLAPSTGNATITWSVIATNSNGFSTTYTGASYSDEPNTGVTATASATPSSVCTGSTTSLSVSVNAYPLSELFNNSTTTQFSIVNTSGTGSANQNTTYYSEGASSFLFNTSSFSADVQLTQLNAISLINVASATLSFSHICATEAGWDYGYVQYSTNNGSTWSNFPTTSYSGSATLKNSAVCFDKSSYSDWGSQFSSISSTPGTGPATTLWKNESITIPSAALTSSQFKIRFRYTTDGTDNYYGWLIDNLKIITVLNPTANSWSDGSSVIGTSNPQTTTVSSTTTYTCTATVNNCPMTASVTPTVNALPSAPTGNTTQSICPSSATVANLTATGSAIQWFANPTGGTALATTTALVDGTQYYASQTTNGCSSATRLNVTALIRNQWSGSTSSDWNTSSNWSCSVVPGSTNNAFIPTTGITNYPVLSVNAAIKDLNIGSGTIGLNGQTFTINGAVSGTGTISGSATSSIVIGANNAAGTLNFTSGSNSLKNLTLNASSTATLGNALNIATGATPGVLTVNTGATLTTGGFLTLKSDATGTARVANSAGTISGEVSVERYIPQNSNRAWRALAVPTYSATQTIANSWQLGTLITGPGGANGLDQSTGGFSMMSYNPATDQLVGVDNMSNVISGNTAAPAAYYLYVRGDRNTGVANTNLNPTATTLSSKGSLYQGNVTVTAASNVSGTTYHLLGNPYVSPINLNSFYNANSLNIDNTFYLYDPQILNAGTGVGALITLTVSGSSYTPSVTGASYSGSISEIPSGMAFFITKSSSSTSSSIVFNESMKTTGSTISNGYNGLKTTAAVDGQLQINLNVKINDSTLRPADGILAIFDANEKVQVDGADARKMSNFGENMSINNHGDLLAIEKRPLFNQDTLHINTTGLTNRLYSLRFNPSQFQNASSALLIDHYTHSTQSIPLQSVSEYAFTIDANAQSKGPNRFDVVFEQAALQIATTKKLMAIELYPNPVSEGVINISMHQQKEGNYTVSIVNALGAEIQKENWHHSNGDQIHSINVNKLASGIYYLKISNEFGDQSMHKFIQSSSNF